MGVEHIPIQSITTLQIHFAEKPYDEEIEAINAYWEALEDDAEEAVSFKTKEQLQAEREADEAAKLAYARAKLKSFGLTDAEIDALKGS